MSCTLHPHPNAGSSADLGTETVGTRLWQTAPVATVWLAPVETAAPTERVEAVVRSLWSHAGFDALIEPHDLAAVKLHVGEPGCSTFIPPRFVAPIVERITACGAEAFLTDTAVLYRSPRNNGVTHVKVAHEHGFTEDAIGAPFLPADGLTGADAREIEVNGRHHETVAVASGILQARSMVLLSHATGHLGTGLGAALKNLGMGCCSRGSKLRQHHGAEPRIDPQKCLACGVCAEWCPADAIAVDVTAVIDRDACIGCGECVAACREGAVRFDWGIAGRQLQERMAEHAAGVVRSKRGRIAYITALLAVTKDCDCVGIRQTPVVADIGLLASHDPVAIDQAALDLIREHAGTTLEDLSYPNHDATIQLAYAEELGLGSRRYELELVVE